MSIPQWQSRAQLATPTFNPNQGLATAMKAFQGINEQFAAEEEAAALAAHREAQLANEAKRISLAEQAQAWTEGAPARKIAEENRLLTKNANKAQLIAGAAKGLAYQGADRFAAGSQIDKILSADPRYAALSDETWEGWTQEQRNAELLNPKTKLGYRNKILTENPGAASGADPKLFAQNLRQTLVDTGKFTNDEVNAAVAAETSRYFPTMSPEILKATLQAIKPAGRGATTILSGGSGRTSRGRSGTNKLLRDPANITDQRALEEHYMQRFDVKPGTYRSWWDAFTDFLGAGNYSLNQRQLAKVENLGTADGISPEGMRAGLQVYMDTGGDISFDPDAKIPPKILNNIKAIGTAFDDQQAQMYNSKDSISGTLQAEARAAQAGQQAYLNQVTKLLSGASPRRLSDQELAESFLSDLGPKVKTGKKSGEITGGGSGGISEEKQTIANILSTIIGDNDAQDMLLFANAAENGPTPILKPRSKAFSSDRIMENLQPIFNFKKKYQTGRAKIFK